MGTETPASGPVAAPPAMPTPEDLAVAIRKGWETFVNSSSFLPSKRQNVYASGYRECDRRMVLEMTEGDKLKPFGPETLARFRRGNDRERDLVADLKKIGRNCDPSFEVVGEQERFEVKDRKGRVVLTGKKDANLLLHGGIRIRGERSIPLEAKSWNQNLVAKIEKFEDLFNNRWTKGGAYQLLSYLYGFNLPVGMLLLDKSGIPTLIPVELYENLERMERFLRKAEQAMDHKEAGTLPDYTTDPDECKVCDFFGSVCNPPVRSGAGARIITDPEIVADAERYVELREKLEADGLDEYEGLDKWAKKEFRGVTTGIAGNLLISGKWIKGKKYNVPADVEKDLIARKEALDKEWEKYAEVDKENKFKLSIVRVTE